MENLASAMRREEGGLEQSEDEGSDYHSSSLMEGRAISCSDLLLDIERPKVCVERALALICMHS